MQIYTAFLLKDSLPGTVLTFIHVSYTISSLNQLSWSKLLGFTSFWFLSLTYFLTHPFSGSILAKFPMTSHFQIQRSDLSSCLPIYGLCVDYWLLEIFQLPVTLSHFLSFPSPKTCAFTWLFLYCLLRGYHLFSHDSESTRIPNLKYFATLNNNILIFRLNYKMSSVTLNFVEVISLIIRKTHDNLLQTFPTMKHVDPENNTVLWESMCLSRHDAKMSIIFLHPSVMKEQLKDRQVDRRKPRVNSNGAIFGWKLFKILQFLCFHVILAFLTHKKQLWIEQIT